MKAMERFKTWCKRTTVAETGQSDGGLPRSTVVSCSCLPRSRSLGGYEMRKAPDPDAGALADIKAHNRTHQPPKGCIPKVVVLHFHSPFIFLAPGGF